MKDEILSVEEFGDAIALLHVVHSGNPDGNVTKAALRAHDRALRRERDAWRAIADANHEWYEKWVAAKAALGGSK